MALKVDCCGEEQLKISSYNHLITNSGAISVEDATKLAKIKGYVPTSWSEALIQVKGYTNFLMAFLGYQHAVTQKYIEGYEFLEYIYLNLQRGVKERVGPKLGPALVVYHFQLKIRAWFKYQWMSLTPVPAPDFVVQDLMQYEESQNLE